MFVIIKTLQSSTVGTVKHEGLGKQDWPTAEMLHTLNADKCF